MIDSPYEKHGFRVCPIFDEQIVHIWDGNRLIITLSGLHRSRDWVGEIIAAYQQGRNDGGYVYQDSNFPDAA